MTASLLDLAGVGATVEVRGTLISVTGISAFGLAHLFRRFPQLGAAISGKGLDLTDLSALGPEVVAAAIAAGTGHPGDERAEAVAASLGLADQLSVMQAVAAETFGGTVENFMKRLADAAAVAGVQVETAAE